MTWLKRGSHWKSTRRGEGDIWVLGAKSPKDNSESERVDAGGLLASERWTEGALRTAVIIIRQFWARPSQRARSFKAVKLWLMLPRVLFNQEKFSAKLSKAKKGFSLPILAPHYSTENATIASPRAVRFGSNGGAGE
jgi:hypothetical protein